ncbi:MAG: DUF5110 domain-containing protein [Prevotella sp.]|nr:DUF5110 domain-containing protein [Prevotella sp.]
MRKLFAIVTTAFLLISLTAKADDIPFGNGLLKVTPLMPNAVRIQYIEGNEQGDVSLPEWMYVPVGATGKTDLKVADNDGRITVSDKEGRVVLVAQPELQAYQAENGEKTRRATLRISSPADEYLYGLGQFQDGFVNVKGLMRRLTQVNTQISLPMLLSNKGYGLLWNNYGLTDLNPSDRSVPLVKTGEKGETETVNVTSTEGGRLERREHNRFEATLDIDNEGDYAILLDIGQKMARRHNLNIDGTNVIEMRNLWLPPTASTIVHLTAGSHRLEAELSNGDQPVVYYRLVDAATVLQSPVAQCVDFTLFTGSADDIIAAYRQLTGKAPMMPKWALGYIHCRERFHSQEEILTTAQRFRQERLPVDVMVQDWQYWGKYGWNSMRFDEEHYPDPNLLTDSLHRMGMRLMVSVWSKIDKNSEVGQQMERDGYYIPGTDWIDFFSENAANAYWANFSRRLLPLGIDAWWQDATEPENDDLVGRRVNGGKWAGEVVRNVYPLLVNKTVFEGLKKDQPTRRPMILTRCGFPGIQRYGSAMWSGDVGNDWETLRRQISAGLGMQAAGIPWWTYDAGGFFRPGDQYHNQDYIERMLRWIETSVYLPLMRVHGYMSNTEPWNYGDEAQAVIAECLKERYRLLPYIYSCAAAVSYEDYTLMRPLVFDFADDEQALQQKQTYMFGPSLLVSPVTESQVTVWRTYLPICKGGWYDRRLGQHFDGGQTVTTKVDKGHIPVFVKAGSILPLGVECESTATSDDSTLDICIYPGADADFTLYSDDGVSNDYEQGQYARVVLHWDDTRQELTIGKREGAYKGMTKRQTMRIHVQGKGENIVKYNGKKLKVKP